MIEKSAPAKVILFGEHAAVFGKPAIAVPVRDVRAYAVAHPNEAGRHGLYIAAELSGNIPVSISSDQIDSAIALTAKLVLQALNAQPPDLTVSIRSQIPVASGLGSGAAVSTALARALVAALGQSLDDAGLNGLIYEVEKIHHGTPSGIDNTVVVYERPVYFVKNQTIETFTPSPFHLLIGDTGISASTRVTVGAVRDLEQEFPDQIRPILGEIGSISKRARRMIETGDMETLGSLMNHNHRLLQLLTVSSPELDMLVEAAVRAGALGAKMSGGGRGGNMIALVQPETRGQVEAALRSAGAVRVYATEVS